MQTINILLIAAVLYCAYTDISERKIKNYITFPLMAIGIIYNSYVSGTQGLMLSIQGMVLCGAIALIFFIVNGFGMGDVKLFMGIGSIMGFQFTLDVLVFSLFAAVIINTLLKPRLIGRAMKNIYTILKGIVVFRSFNKLPQSNSALVIPFAVYVFMGLVIAYQMGGHWLWQLLIK